MAILHSAGAVSWELSGSFRSKASSSSTGAMVLMDWKMRFVSKKIGNMICINDM
jgi:hypothetical protein